jgi:hypothetical protein
LATITGGFAGLAGLATISGLAGAAGLATISGLTGVAGGLGELGGAGRAGAAGLSGAAAGEASAFFTDRIALLGAVPAGDPVLGWAELPFEIKDRIFAASSSLIELLWLFAATPS